MKSLRNTVLGLTLSVTSASFAMADDLTIAIVNNGHMINMQKVAEAYTAETGVTLNWVALEEGVLREQVTSDTATGGGQYDIINIGMQEAPIWGAAGWIEPLNFSAEYDVDDILPAMRAGLSHNGTLYAAPFYGESSMVMYRKDLADALRQQCNSDHFDFIAHHRGMFSRLGLNAEQVLSLREDHGMYLVGDSRINIAGLAGNRHLPFAIAVAKVATVS